uniref:WW domain-containing adapter protein with coiled-coil n=2 Tax=Homo sapiens TaxID=9606 RepID=A0A0A0MSR1_HUMAN
MRDAGDPSPPNKMLRRSDSPENKYSDSTGHSKAKNVHTHRVRERDGGTSYSPQENSHNHSALHSSNSHSSNPSNNPSKTSDAPYDSADDWSEHISSSGKKYYYNCRTEVSQWEKPKEWLEREQRQKEANKMAVNSFPKDRDYRREVMQATATSGFASGIIPTSVFSNCELKWKTSIPVMPVVCSHRIFCLKQADTMTETTDCQEQRLTVVLRQYSTPSNQWFIQLLPQALFLLVHLRYSLITSQRNHLMLMEHLLYQNCLHPHLLSLHRKQKEKNLHQETNPYHILAQLLPRLLPLD